MKPIEESIPRNKRRERDARQLVAKLDSHQHEYAQVHHERRWNPGGRYPTR